MDFINGAHVIGSTKQRDVDFALTSLLGKTAAESSIAAVPAAATNTFALTAELDSIIAPEGQAAMNWSCLHAQLHYFVLTHAAGCLFCQLLIA